MSSPGGRNLVEGEASYPDDDGMEYDEERRVEDPVENEDDDLSPTDVVTPRDPAGNVVSSTPPRVVPYVKRFCDGTGKATTAGPLRQRCDQPEHQTPRSSRTSCAREEMQGTETPRPRGQTRLGELEARFERKHEAIDGRLTTALSTLR